MGALFWLLSPLAGFLILVVGYGSSGAAASEPGSWVDFVFWGMMALGTLPAVGMLLWLQLLGLRQCRDHNIGRKLPRRLRPMARV